MRNLKTQINEKILNGPVSVRSWSIGVDITGWKTWVVETTGITKLKEHIFPVKAYLSFACSLLPTKLRGLLRSLRGISLVTRYSVNEHTFGITCRFFLFFSFFFFAVQPVSKTYQLIQCVLRGYDKCNNFRSI